ncbi:MAG: hypothetical protein Q8N12_00380 [Thermodesulfovibrionales bacterium]|nr:hypothetical protein [Thermodesulfovibrionales bacterium]MDP3047871.1 hypothetical protein [Thermodesulfovibrionales bacterium]
MRKLDNCTKKYTNPSLPLVGNPSVRFRTNRKDSGQAGMTRSGKIFVICFFLILFLLLTTPYSSFVTASDKWQGVDESVVEKYAKEHGREAREPFINTDQGDLLLFVFLLAGTVGGFAGGYYWRILMVEKSPDAIKKMQKNTD